MDQDSVENKLLHFIDEVVLGGQGADLTPATPLFALGILDSFALFRIIGFLADEFGVTVNLATLKVEEFESVATMAAFVRAHATSARDEQATQTRKLA